MEELSEMIKLVVAAVVDACQEAQHIKHFMYRPAAVVGIIDKGMEGIMKIIEEHEKANRR